MAPAALPLLLLCSLLGLAFAQQATPSSTLVPDQIFYQQIAADQLAVFAPGIEFEGVLVRTTNASSPQRCALDCATDARCDVFGATECAEVEADGCTPCRLLRMKNCTFAPTVGQTPAGASAVTQTGGFPIKNTLNDMPGFTAQGGQGVPGADIPCLQSLLPGKCALRSPYDAVMLCVRTPDCQAVTVYFNGTDGCSPEPLAVLKHDALTQSGAFMSPLVATLSRVDYGQLRGTTLMAVDGNVTLPPPSELARAGAAVTNSTYLGCIVSQHVLLSGTPVEVLDGVASADACCRRCRSDARCNLWQWCALEYGCSYTIAPAVYQLAYRQCKLLFNDVMAPPISFPPAVIEKMTDIPFVGGAPLVLYAEEVPKFEARPGHNQFAFSGGSFNCSFSIKPETEECVVNGTNAQQLADQCAQTPQCAGFLMRTGATKGSFEGVLKTTFDPAAEGLSPSDALYLRQGFSPGPPPAAAPAEASSDGNQSSSGLSAGAFAGIAVGAAAAAAAAACAAWLVVRRRRGAAVQQGAKAGGADDDAHKHDLCTIAEEGGASPRYGSSAPPTGDTAASAASWATSGAVVAGGVRSVCHPLSTGGSIHAASPFAAGPAPSGDTAASPFTGRMGSFGPIFGPSVAASAPASRGPSGSSAGSGAGPGRAAGSAPGMVRVVSAAVPSARATASPFAAMAAARAQAAGPVGAAPGAVAAPFGGSVALSATPSARSPIGSAHSARSLGLIGLPSGGSMGMSPGPSPPATAGPSRMLPELADHIAQCDAAQGGSHQGAVAGDELHSEATLLVPGALPQSLLDWIVDASEVEYLQWPNGSLHELGKGASGTVYKARFRGEVVAAKAVELGRSAAIQALFVTEAERLHQLRHGNIIALYGVCLAGPIGVLLMEHAAGRDLHAALHLTKAGSDERLFGWYGRGRQVAFDISRALNFLHAKGVAHLDIKSSNVLLSGTGTAKLADVGLARIQRGTYLSDLPGGIGTFAWMAPEMMMNKKCTTAVDLFSFGVVLWEIVTGETPRRGSMRMPRVPEECPQEVADMIQQCMALEPTDRPTAKQLMRQLEELCHAGKQGGGGGEGAGRPGGPGSSGSGKAAGSSRGGGDRAAGSGGGGVPK